MYSSLKKLIIAAHHAFTMYKNALENNVKHSKTLYNSL